MSGIKIRKMGSDNVGDVVSSGGGDKPMCDRLSDRQLTM